MTIVNKLALTAAAAIAAVACSSAAPSGDEATSTTSSAVTACNPACTQAWTDCQPMPNKRTTILSCQACGAQGQAPCDASGPDQGCQPIPNGYLGLVNGTCQQCGQADGQPACGGTQCAPWNPSTGFNGIPQQPLDVVNGVCKNCGNIDQPACHVGGSIFCNEGLNDYGWCIACAAGQPVSVCGYAFCNDNSCQEGIATYCPKDGQSATGIKCVDGCGNHGGRDPSIGCQQQP